MGISSTYKLLSRLVLTTVLLLLLPVLCHASNGGFSFETKDTIEHLAIASKLNIQPVEDTAVRKGFCCFDVNEKGKFALGFDHAEYDILLVYDNDGEYLYGFSFHIDGAWGVGWEGNNIILFCVRSDLAITIDERGTCIEVAEIEENPDNQAYWNHEVFANTRDVNGVVYTAKHWLVNSPLIHWGQYPMLIQTFPTGESTVLFDAFQRQPFPILRALTIAGIFLASGVVVFLLLSIRSQKKRRHCS